ncbi:hypothetical protein [Oceanivirga salmonicida]|uniref:hypothetical protein n=1 Tax=Oceanivirga salmonicida TaxID=1769291 RepID=UPI0012E24168|nr:hypothetical protein [Oceanivirga salmonicida]
MKKIVKLIFILFLTVISYSNTKDSMKNNESDIIMIRDDSNVDTKKGDKSKLYVVSASTDTKFAKDYINVKNLNFNGEKYRLAWSSVADKGYLQEYLLKGTNFDNYEKMLTIIATKIDASAYEFAISLNKSLEGKYNFIKNYEIVGSDDIVIETILENDEYTLYRISKQKNYIITYFFTYRAKITNKEEFEKFTEKIDAKRTTWLKEVFGMKMPKLKITSWVD